MEAEVAKVPAEAHINVVEVVIPINKVLWGLEVHVGMTLPLVVPAAVGTMEVEREALHPGVAAQVTSVGPEAPMRVHLQVYKQEMGV